MKTLNKPGPPAQPVLLSVLILFRVAFPVFLLPFILGVKRRILRVTVVLLLKPSVVGKTRKKKVNGRKLNRRVTRAMFFLTEKR